MTAADSCQQPFRLILEAGDFSLSPGPVVRGGHGRNLLCPGARTWDQFGKTGHKIQKLFRILAQVSCFVSAMATYMGSIHADSSLDAPPQDRFEARSAAPAQSIRRADHKTRNKSIPKNKTD